jgi:cyclopropane fatty-acyl-phospholipid synthase-like methyltransferase
MAWAPDEEALSGTDHLVTAADVARYVRRQGFNPTDEIALLCRLGLTERDRLIEFGSGPGGFALAAAAVAGEVIAVDPSQAMISYVSERVHQLGITNVSVVKAGFLSYRHRGLPVGFVFTKNALHQLPDFWKMQALLRVHGLLEPDGVLRLRDLVFSFLPQDADRRISAWIDEVSSREGGWSRDELEAHVRSEFSTYCWVLEEMLARAGFTVTDAWYSDSGIYAHYTCNRQ